MQLQHLLPPTGPQSFHLLTQFTTILTQSSNLPTIGEHVVPWNIELEYRGTGGGAPAQRVLRLRVDPRNGAGLRTGHTPKTHTISVEPGRSVCSSILQPNTRGTSPDPSCYPLFPPRSRRLIQSYKFTCNPQQSLKSQHNRRTQRAVEYRTRV